MIEERDGWFVVNVKDARWVHYSAFGLRCVFEGDEKFAEVGIGITILEPGKPACRYHRESAQEDFLVLSGQCKVIANDEERALGPWDFVHCPAGVSHVFVGAGDGPCAILMIGARKPDHEVYYPSNEKARVHGAESPEPTADPRVAYSDVEPFEDVDAPRWPLGDA